MVCIGFVKAKCSRKLKCSPQGLSRGQFLSDSGLQRVRIAGLTGGKMVEGIAKVVLKIFTNSINHKDIVLFGVAVCWANRSRPSSLDSSWSTKVR